jgi:ankyrin repeat protein
MIKNQYIIFCDHRNVFLLKCNYMSKINIIDSIDIINSYSNNKKLNHEFLSILEKAITNNYLSVVKESFISGDTIYQNDIICNGFYQQKISKHPSKCHPSICYKTSLYYALWLNTYYYSNIFYSIIEILDDCPSLWFNLNESTDIRDKKIKHLSLSLKKLYDFVITIECSCNCIEQYTDFYDHNNMNFGKVEKYMSSNFEELLNQFEIVYSFGEYHKEDNFDIVCHKRYIGKYYIYDHNIIENIDIQKIRDKLEFIRQNWINYKSNCEIVNLLYNQQAFEYYRHHLRTKFFKLQNIIEKISLNPYININYSLNGNNIFSITIFEQNRPELTNRLIKLNAKIPQQLSFDDIIRACDITNIKEIIKNYREDYFGDIGKMIKSIISYDNIMSGDKIEIIEILNKRKILEKIENVVGIFIEHNLSYGFIEKIYENPNIINQISIIEVYLCIKYLKPRELDLILKNRNELVNKKYNNKEPLFHYFDELSEDIPVALEIMKTLLLNKADTNIQDSSGQTPLMIAIKLKSFKTFQMLLNFNANPFIYDEKMFNSFHYAIKNNCIKMIQSMIQYNNDKNEKIINVQNNICPLILAMESKNPINITRMLLNEQDIDYNYKTKSGDNLLFYILNLKTNQSIKYHLFSLFLKFDINLIEPSKITHKPLVVELVEKNYYEIVIMIMNKLLQIGEILFEGFDNIKDIHIILKEGIIPSIFIKNNQFPNFYSLVLVYLNSNKNNKMKILNENEIYVEIEIDKEIVRNGLFLIIISILMIFAYKEDIDKFKRKYDEKKEEEIIISRLKTNTNDNKKKGRKKRMFQIPNFDFDSDTDSDSKTNSDSDSDSDSKTNSDNCPLVNYNSGQKTI